MSPDSKQATAPNADAPRRPDARLTHNGLTNDGWSTEDEATATCFCGQVQLVVPLKAPGLVGTFLCSCTDCRKVTASVFATNFTTLDLYTRFTRGEDNLTIFSQKETTSTGGSMTNGFCKTCGTLMFRQGSKYPGTKFLRVGTIDDLRLHDTVLKPQVEQFTSDRVAWFHGVDTARQVPGFAFFAEAAKI